jgi:hypothetical protein
MHDDDGMEDNFTAETNLMQQNEIKLLTPKYTPIEPPKNIQKPQNKDKEDSADDINMDIQKLGEENQIPAEEEKKEILIPKEVISKANPSDIKGLTEKHHAMIETISHLYKYKPGKKKLRTTSI